MGKHLPVSSGRADEPVRVVIVDDEDHLRTLVTLQLEPLGFEVTECDPRAEDPVDAVARAEPDAVLLDWRLPREPGPTVCRRLRSSAHGRDVAIVFLTGLDDPRDQTTARDAGADGFCVKGIEPAALALRVRRAIALRRGAGVRAGR